MIFYGTGSSLGDYECAVGSFQTMVVGVAANAVCCVMMNAINDVVPTG